MSTNYTFLVSAAVVAVMGLASCTEIHPPTQNDIIESTNPDPAHNSENSIDWEGLYMGTLPCADCEGIRTTITLLADRTYRRELMYLGKSAGHISESGTFEFSPDGGKVTLGVGESATTYRVGENALFHLDREGNIIQGSLADAYRIPKVNERDNAIEGIKWVLTELNGAIFPEGSKEAWFIMDPASGRVHGNTSCNNFFGQYQLLGNGRLRFGKMGATKMACPDMSHEQALHHVFETADNYTVAEGVLSLHKARMAPLALFRAEKESL
jgi:heat shock protein HslJ